MSKPPIHGGTYLILIQVVSRGLTFVSNQFLLRYVPPATLGLAAQLELYAISTLYLCRESIRVAAQQQSASPEGNSESSNGSKDKPTQKLQQPGGIGQGVVNISYLPILLGVPFVYLLGRTYLHATSGSLLDGQFFAEGVMITGISVVIELASEPAFAVIQQGMLFRRRAAIETVSAFVKGALSCTVALFLARRNITPGVLPFAIGQLGFALTLLIRYITSAHQVATEAGISLLPHSLHAEADSKPAYLSRLIPLRLLSRSANVYFQSVAKHLLTQGDTMVLAALASLEDQGLYALASNYGGLVARMVFQPLEESSRNVLGKLTASDNGAASHPERVATAKAYLSDILHAYGIFSILACVGGPAAIPLAIKIFMGRHWTSPEMLELLLAYCYYIPFLAFNGITEAFVSSTATNTELRQQTGWMTAFSVAFAAAVYLFLGVCKLGAVGLVWANMVNMALRIMWSHWFIKRYFRSHSVELHLVEALPSLWTLAAGVLAYASLATMRPSIESGMMDMLRAIGIAMIAGISILYLERNFLKRQISHFK